ncbi:MAG: SPOR domain-containing protein [Betaproteobacteria bacterium]|nr:SPOR domain-containing protein [Betaproteobacteria bacterium]
MDNRATRLPIAARSTQARCPYPRKISRSRSSRPNPWGLPLPLKRPRTPRQRRRLLKPRLLRRPCPVRPLWLIRQHGPRSRRSPHCHVRKPAVRRPPCRRLRHGQPNLLIPRHRPKVPRRPHPSSRRKPRNLWRRRNPPSGVSQPTPPAPPRLFSGFAVQAGVFADAQRAEELRAMLTLNGIPSTLEARVQVGPFKTREEAEAARQKLKALGIEGLLLPPRGSKR